MTPLASLREQVAAATGPDRELDALLWWATADHSQTDGDVLARAEVEGTIGAIVYYFGPRWADLNVVPRLTASIDAAVALVERCLPGWLVQLNTGDPTRKMLTGAWAKVEPHLHNDDGWTIGARDARGPTVPLAILSALLAALDRKDPRDA